MKDRRKNNKTTFIILSIVFVIFVILVIVKFIYNPGSDLKMGWISHEQSNIWTADYSYFTGTETNNMEGTNTKLNVDVETEKGSLEITLKDNDDNILFSEVISETTSFNVDVPKNVIVSVSGKEHDGGFKISY